MVLDLDKVIINLKELDSQMVQSEIDFKPLLAKIHPLNSKRALNLLHYLSLRNHDIRELQDELHSAGLSSMASSESHIRHQLISILHRLGVEKEWPDSIYSFQMAKGSLEGHVSALFGKKSDDGGPYLMVTFDEELADNYAKVKGLLLSGMNVARINCAHDDESAWIRMIQHIKRASRITGVECKIYMDLAGPKIRTVLKGREKLKIKEGHSFYLTDEENLEKGMVGCTIPGIVAQIKSGETVLFDDGLIEARVDKVEDNKARLQVIRISSKKPYIKSEKGINFPDSSLGMSALTEYDMKCLPFIVRHADMIGYSFVRSADDVDQLLNLLPSGKKPYLIIKIETPEAVKNLPQLLFAGLKEENLGVMIARGDLAVEIGFERMSEIQEEILWICEAAHVPVIWATQVLENLNKSGIATRSEVTDAAHAVMADCVMINKGSHIIRTMETLRDILGRSGSHHSKKRYTLRPLSIASRFFLK